LTGGARIRAYYVLRKLSQKHQITLVSFLRSEDKAQDVAHLASFCQGVHGVPMVRSRRKNVASLVESLGTGQPAIIIRDRSQAMEQLVSDLVRRDRFHVAHADQTSMAQYALHAHEVSRKAKDVDRLATILDQHNALYRLVQRQSSFEPWFSRPLWRREARLLADYERTLCQQFDQIVTVTGEDKQALLTLFSESEASHIESKLSAVPICVDAGSRNMVLEAGHDKQIVHLGTMFWPPNIEGVLWFANEVLPLIWRQIPETRFVVAGKDPPRKVVSLAEGHDPGQGQIVVTGFVDDPQPLLERSQVFIVPVRAGGGMRVKIVDAWLWGLPVVSTTIGAEGLRTIPGENIILADTPETFAAAVVELLNEPGKAKEMRMAGRRWVEEHYDYRSVYSQIETVYRRVDNQVGA
jgi:glycosyltransferase involved in cell wall biosynthesis